MKKIILTALAVAFSLALFCPVRAADDASIDKSTVDKGYFTIKYNGDFEKIIKLQVFVEGKEEKYNYDLTTNDPVTVPLQLGNGKYTVYVLRNVTGTSYTPLFMETFSADIKSPNEMFKISNPYVNFSTGMEFFKGYSKVFAPITDINAKVSSYYDEVVQKYSYDHDKLKNLPSGYVPVIDKTYAAKKGICSDYSTLLAGFLRGIGVPVKVVMGYAPEIKEYHAWNEIYIGGKWVTVDATYDSAYYLAGYKYSMVKDSSKFQVIKVY